MTAESVTANDAPAKYRAAIRDQLEKLAAAAERAEWCAACSEGIAPDAPVWRAIFDDSWGHRVTAPICESCQQAHNVRGLHRSECGNCGRVVHTRFRDSYGPYGERTVAYFCSERCRRELAKARRRVTPTERACETCGEPFTPKRADARYCGPTCRQRAHRRVTDNRSLNVDRADNRDGAAAP
jgi:hypothetical protein